MHATVMEFALKRPSPLWFLGPNSIIVVYMDPLGSEFELKVSGRKVFRGVES